MSLEPATLPTPWWTLMIVWGLWWRHTEILQFPSSTHWSNVPSITCDKEQKIKNNTYSDIRHVTNKNPNGECSVQGPQLGSPVMWPSHNEQTIFRHIHTPNWIVVSPRKKNLISLLISGIVVKVFDLSCLDTQFLKINYLSYILCE